MSVSLICSNSVLLSSKRFNHNCLHSLQTFPIVRHVECKVIWFTVEDDILISLKILSIIINQSKHIVLKFLPYLIEETLELVPDVLEFISNTFLNELKLLNRCTFMYTNKKICKSSELLAFYNTFNHICAIRKILNKI